MAAAPSRAATASVVNHPSCLVRRTREGRLGGDYFPCWRLNLVADRPSKLSGMLVCELRCHGLLVMAARLMRDPCVVVGCGALLVVITGPPYVSRHGGDCSQWACWLVGGHCPSWRYSLVTDRPSGWESACRWQCCGIVLDRLSLPSPWFRCVVSCRVVVWFLLALLHLSLVPSCRWKVVGSRCGVTDAALRPRVGCG